MTPEVNYSRFDRMLHRAAFATPVVQLTAADIEQALYGASYKQVAAKRPIFITSLPRAGTTVLLDALSQFPSLASHIYRDMPFVMAPVLWSKLVGPFRQPQALKERAHGDGMEVGFDSPEAFEEVLWRSFWPAKYTRVGIALWERDDVRRDARTFFLNHMKKIVALRRPDRTTDGRYLSKNNANIGRLAVINRLFPDATVVLPVRRPLEHAKSLLRQHLRFLDMQREEPFVERYMADIGHYEFGTVHRPLAFPKDGDLAGNDDPSTLEYWLAYWIAAFEYVLCHRDRIVIVSYEEACDDPSRLLRAICERLAVPEEGALPMAVARFKDAPPARVKPADTDDRLRQRAEHVYDSLMKERLT